ncbi:MAG: hypothetical protein HC942_07865 [Microcoleus sp. SU_5_6]|nr:hypothetical protein [Microcoleus sp. SU_5_6]
MGIGTAHCQLSTVNCQLSTINCQLSTVNCYNLGVAYWEENSPVREISQGNSVATVKSSA